MTKSEFCDLLARRLGAPDARIASILERLHAAGVVKPEKGSRKYPSEIDEHDAVAIFLAVLADRGLATVADDACSLAAIDGEGGRFFEWTMRRLFGVPRHVQHLIVQHQPPAATAVVDNRHIRFGPRVEKAGKIVLGRQLAAIAAELRGMRPSDADAAAAIMGI